MRKIYLFALMLMVVFLPGTTALSQEQEDALMLADKSLWIAEGDNPDRPVYVIFSTACGYSKKMYDESQQFKSGYQFRWIPVGGPDAGWLAMHGGPEDLAERIGSPGPAGTDEASQQAIRHNNIFLHKLARTSGMRSLSFPVIIWHNGSRTRIRSVRDNLPAMLQDVAAIETGRDPDKFRTLIASTPLYEPDGAGGQFSARSGDAPVYMYPDTDSLVLTIVKTGYVLPQKGRTPDGKWAAVQPFSGSMSDVTGYILAE
ncbi:MAG: hypothetical protein EOM20_20530 [Spartobacteria bacterium]|nr:hypothetical protein [Spartobacteria bacterium]